MKHRLCRYEAANKFAMKNEAKRLAMCRRHASCPKVLHVHSTLNVHEVNASLKKSRLGVIFSGGAEESRTPVRKPIHTPFYERSLLLKFSFLTDNKRTVRKSSFIKS